VSVSVSQQHLAASLEGEAVIVRETPLIDGLPLYGQPEWNARYPWLLQGITGRGTGEPFDLSFFGQARSATVLERWRAIRSATGFRGVVHARQVHGADLLCHDQHTDGVRILDDADGHVTSQKDLLLAVSVADCVPVSLVDKNARVSALLHAGWRSAAAGILERGVQTLVELGSGSAREILCHFGPAICGTCYEVGPEVHAALGLPRPQHNTPIDLRTQLVRRALALGLEPGNISRSAYCTRCDGGLFFSHRAGDRERQMSVLGLRQA
jgi:YfiH family protein